MAKQTIEKGFLKKPKTKRKGIRVKSKNAKNKKSKNWKKPYKGQGR